MPVDYMRGSISGRQEIKYSADGAAGYDVPVGTKAGAIGYQPRIVAQLHCAHRSRYLRTFQVRTRTSVHMTTNMRSNLAQMGGAGALFASLVNNKTSQIYIDCMRVCPDKMSLRAFMIPILRSGLRSHAANISVADGVTIINPWVSSATPNVPVTQAILDKFADELSNS